MDKNQSLMLAAVVFGVIALLHLIRAVLGLKVMISSYETPAWISYFAFIVVGYLAWHMHNASNK